MKTRPVREVTKTAAERHPRFIFNIATILSAQVARALISLLLEILYARFLGPAGRGQLSLGMMVFGCGVLIGGLGGEIPIMLWSAGGKRDWSDWLPSVLFCGLLGSGLAAGVWGFLFWVWHPDFLRGITHTLALLLLSSIPFSILGTYCLAFLVGLDRLRERSLIVVLNQSANVAVTGALFYFFRPSAELAFIAFLAGLGAALLAGGIFLKAHLRLPESGNRAVHWLARVGPALSLGVRGQLGNVATFFN